MAKQAQKPKSAYSAPRKVQPAKKKSALSPAALLIIIAAAVLVVAGIIILATRANTAPITATNRVGEGAAWGPANAPVKVTIYSDFGCSHCRDWGQSQEKQLRADYEASGKVRYEYKSQNIGGTPTRDAANAAECAADQGKFWDYHDALFGRQGTSANPFTKPLLKRYAAELGLDAAKFDPCVDNNAHYNDVRAQEAEATNKGVNATPTIFINDKEVGGGAVPYKDFKPLVDAAIAAAM
jgi:protein-disulfide isomerase